MFCQDSISDAQFWIQDQKELSGDETAKRTLRRTGCVFWLHVELGSIRSVFDHLVNFDDVEHVISLHVELSSVWSVFDHFGQFQ